MTRHSAIGAFLLGAAIAAAPLAQAADLKIGYVNFGRLLEESPQAKSAQAALEGEFLPRQRDVAAQQKSLEEKRDKLKREAAVMSEADRTRTEREVRDLEVSLQRRFNEVAGRPQPAPQRGSQADASARCSMEVQSYAKANGYQLVVSEGVLYASRGHGHHAAGRRCAQVEGAGAPRPPTPPRT